MKVFSLGKLHLCFFLFLQMGVQKEGLRLIYPRLQKSNHGIPVLSHFMSNKIIYVRLGFNTNNSVNNNQKF